MDKELIAFTVFDENNAKYAALLEKSFHYFHPDIPLRMFGPDDVRKTHDKDIFYKQKPYFANILFNEGYKAVLGLDSDQLIFGKLDYIFDHKDYDIGVVLNFNPLDFRTYGEITFKPLHYATEYYNAGLVMMRSHNLVKHWLKLCNGPFFKRLPYKEQDLLNIIAHFGEYRVKCLDDADDLENYYAWHGLLATHQGMDMIVKNGDIILPESETGYPSRDITVKVWHPAGGQANYDKLNYRTAFSQEVVTRISEILK